MKKIDKCLKKGVSISFYMDCNFSPLDNLLLNYDPIQQIINETSCPIIPVWIKKRKLSKSYLTPWKRSANISFGKEISRKSSFLERHRKLIKLKNLSTPHSSPLSD